MKYDLAQLARTKSSLRRRSIELRPIVPTGALASDLYAVYRPIVEYLSSQIGVIIVAYERASVPAGTVRDAADDMRPQLDGISDYLRQLVATMEPRVQRWAERVSRWHREKWRSAVLSAAGVDLETVLMASGQPQSLGESIAWNVRLIKDVSDQAQARIGSAVFSAFQQRKSARDLAKDIRAIVDMSRTRSLGIAADQLAKLSGALDRERAIDAGLSEYTWRHSHKARPRPAHVARDGKVFRYDSPPEDGPPGTQPWCGCRAQARLTLG